MKNILSVLLLLIFLIQCNPIEKHSNIDTLKGQSDHVSFYVGTYTNVKSPQEGGSQGIYKYLLDDKGIMTKVGLAAVTENPSFLTKTEDNQFIIAVNETDNYNEQGKVISYKIIGDKLEKLSESTSGGAHPCHISANSIGQVIVSNYSSGNVGLLNISGKGTLSDLLDVLQHSGSGIHERQKEPHAHSALFRPDGKGVVSVDLGTNDLWFTSIENNKFISQKQQKLEMTDGAGPRHIVFHPTKNLVYVLNELDNTIGIVRVGEEGDYVLERAYSILPDDFNGFSKGADIHMSADGRFLYASNRGHDSIVIFEVKEGDGDLAVIGYESTKGSSPRNFQLAMNDKFVIVGNEKSDNIVCFERDADTGKLKYISQIGAPAPVCLLF